MTLDNIPDGYVRFDKAYDRFLQSKDHFETRQILMSALRSLKIRAHYFDGTGKWRDLSTQFWFLVDTNGLDYTRRWPADAAWKMLTVEGSIKVKDPISGIVEPVDVLIEEKALLHLINGDANEPKDTENKAIIPETTENKQNKSKGGAPKQYDDLLFAAIAASLFAFNGPATYEKRSRSRWREDTLDEYQKRKPDNLPSESWCNEVIRRIEGVVRDLNSREETKSR